MRILAVLLTTLACTTSAHATDPEEVALSCVTTASHEAFDQGWRSRDREVFTQAQGEVWTTSLTLLAGVEYRVLACGDDGAGDVQLALYDVWGKRISLEEAMGQRAELPVSTPITGAYKVAVRGVPNAGFSTAVAVAVLYR